MPDGLVARPVFEAFHLPVGDGFRFCVLHAPPRVGSDEGHDSAEGRAPSIVYVHPFGEEMNKSRRMAALQARALAASGWTVLQIDLAGCGDSSGDFADANWGRWVADVVEAARWLRERGGGEPWLWGLRAGCLLVAEAASAIERVAGFVFWQPVLSGQQHLRQFLRLLVAADVLMADERDGRSEKGSGGTHGPGGARGSVDDLREALLAGAPLDVAGYTLTSALAAGLDAARLVPVGHAKPPPVIWMEVSSATSPLLGPASREEVARWRSSGHAVDARAVAGPAFWQTQEIEESAELVRGTLSALASIGAARTPSDT